MQMGFTSYEDIKKNLTADNSIRILLSSRWELQSLNTKFWSYSAQAIRNIDSGKTQQSLICEAYLICKNIIDFFESMDQSLSADADFSSHS